MNRLNQECKRLDEICPSIVVGIQPSADGFYHLDRTPDGKFFQTKTHPDKSPPDEIRYELEAEIMKPLVSGSEAKRYQKPDTPTYLLFPYDLSGDSPRLWSAEELQHKFPNVWEYLKKYEPVLRSRESSKMDVDDGWWGYNYPKNLDKQELPKLMVPRLVENLISSTDSTGSCYLDNVDVGGVLIKSQTTLWFICGLLNSPVCNFCFHQISKPFRGGFLSANKQFIAPLPIPDATDAQQAAVAALAEKLQETHTARRDEMQKLQTRLDSPNCLDVTYKEDWLWADVKTVAEIKKEAPASITAAREKTAWAKSERQRRLDIHYEKLDALLRPGMNLFATSDADALHVKSGDVTLLTKYGLDPDEARFLAAIWTQILRSTNVTPKFDGEKLVKKLLRFRSSEDAGLRTAILSLHEKISQLDTERRLRRWQKRCKRPTRLGGMKCRNCKRGSILQIALT